MRSEKIIPMLPGRVCLGAVLPFLQAPARPTICGHPYPLKSHNPKGASKCPFCRQLFVCCSCTELGCDDVPTWCRCQNNSQRGAPIGGLLCWSNQTSRSFPPGAPERTKKHWSSQRSSLAPVHRVHLAWKMQPHPGHLLQQPALNPHRHAAMRYQGGFVGSKHPSCLWGSFLAESSMQTFRCCCCYCDGHG